MFSILSLKIRVCPRVLRRQLLLQRTPPYRRFAIIPCRRSKRAGVGVGASFLRPSVLYTCSPMRYLTHTATAPSLCKAADRRLLVLTPHTTTPVICVSLETCVVGTWHGEDIITLNPFAILSLQLHEIHVQLYAYRKDPEVGQRAEGGQRLRNPEKLRLVYPKDVQRTHLQDLTWQDVKVRLRLIHDKGASIFLVASRHLIPVMTFQMRCLPPCASHCTIGKVP